MILDYISLSLLSYPEFGVLFFFWSIVYGKQKQNDKTDLNKRFKEEEKTHSIAQQSERQKDLPLNRLNNKIQIAWLVGWVVALSLSAFCCAVHFISRCAVFYCFCFVLKKGRTSVKKAHSGSMI